MKEKMVFLLTALALSTGCTTSHTNWNQYLGPHRNASIEGVEIQEFWSGQGPKELWSFPLGVGYGGASIFDKEVFVLDRDPGKSDIMRCIDLDSGSEKWKYVYQAPGELPYPGSRAVPTVDQEGVWSVGPHGHFYCFDKKSGQPLWSHNLLQEFDGKLPNWGFSQSPLLYKDLVIVAPGGDRAGVVAFDKRTGELVWESRPLNGHNFHVSPTLATLGGRDQVIMISPYDRSDSTLIQEVVSFDAGTGEELWQYEGLRSFATITPATVIDDKRVFLTDCSYDGSYDPVSIMLEVSREGEEFAVKELFLTEDAGSKMHPAVLFEDHLYLNHTGNPNQMMCLSLDGELLWEKDSAPGFELGAMILVNGLILNQNGKNGDIHLIKPSPEAYTELGKASFFDSKKTQAWGPLAFSQGKLIIRDLEKMVCVDLSQPAL
ncbi:MAG: PQQ-binding-like beta-propeller repeat protein [Bacteroidales bacterium]|nr:PQQ-binding-like beta-propeller repeat protein [Bacteroidales bacterium]